MANKHKNWQLKINGRAAFNGALYGVTFKGEFDLDNANPSPTAIGDVAKFVIDNIQARNREMHTWEELELRIINRSPPSPLSAPSAPPRDS